MNIIIMGDGSMLNINHIVSIHRNKIGDLILNTINGQFILKEHDYQKIKNYINEKK